MVLHHLLVHIPRVSLQWLVCLSTVTVRGRGSRSFSGTLPQPPLVSFRFTAWQGLISGEVCHNLFFTSLTAVYKAPYLLAFCDSALEAYEVTTGKWIQTIPFRKVVNLIMQTWTHYILHHNHPTYFKIPCTQLNSSSYFLTMQLWSGGKEIENVLLISLFFIWE